MEIKIIFAAAALGSILGLGSVNTQADTIGLYDLENFKFDDGSTATGEVRIDFGLEKVTALSLATTAGTTFSGHNYSGSSMGGSEFLFGSPGSTFALELDVPGSLSAYLPSAGNSPDIPLVGNTVTKETDNIGDVRYLESSAYFQAAPVPLPPSLLLMLPAIGAMALVTRRRSASDWRLTQ
jgi:hypothetical protein